MKIGDMVRLKSGGPLMTLGVTPPSQAAENGFRFCKWFDKLDVNQQEVYHLDQLKLVNMNDEPMVSVSRKSLENLKAIAFGERDNGRSKSDLLLKFIVERDGSDCHICKQPLNVKLVDPANGMSVTIDHSAVEQGRD